MNSAKLGIILILTLLAFPIPNAHADRSPVFSDPKTGLSFTIPSNFVLTHYQDATHLQSNIRDLLPRVLVLAERRLHPDKTPIAIGSIPTISLDILTGERAQFNRIFLTPPFETTISGRTVYELPATNGPTTQQLFYYLVPLADGALLEIAEHRYSFTPSDDPATASPTHYDAVIANLLRSLNHQQRSLPARQPTRHS